MAAGEAVYKDLLVRGARRADGSITPSRSASVLWRIWICPFATGDRGFESCFLQRGVRCEPDFLDHVGVRPVRTRAFKAAVAAHGILPADQMTLVANL